MTNDQPARNIKVQKVLLVTLCLNILSWAVKFLWGYWTQSVSMQADSIHTLLDAFSSLLGLVGVLLASQPPDAEHPYGHSKFETMAAIGIAIFIFIGCFEIMAHSVKRFNSTIVPQVTPTSFMIMIASMGMSAALSRWEGRMGGQLKSEVLLADSLHTKSDFYASLAVIVSMIAIQMGYPLLDPLAALAICAVIGATGVKIFVNGIKILMDSSQIDPKAVETLAMEIEGVLACHAVRTHGSKTRVYMDIHIHVAPEMPMALAHQLAHRVESAVINRFQEVVEVVVHLEPHLQNLEND
jgi:cation diffusion facilitator family transporter